MFQILPDPPVGLRKKLVPPPDNSNTLRVDPYFDLLVIVIFGGLNESGVEHLFVSLVEHLVGVLVSSARRAQPGEVLFVQQFNLIRHYVFISIIL